MSDIVVIGGGGHAKVIIGILKKMPEINIIGYTDKADNGTVLGIPYLGTDRVLTELKYENERCSAVIGVGHLKPSNKRLEIYERILGLDFTLPSIVSPHAIINDPVDIGIGTVVFDGVVINPGVRIGKGSIINSNATIEHDCLIGDYVHIAPGATICGGVHIYNNSVIGAGATVIQNITIRDDILIGAGTTIYRDLIEPGTYIGSPLRNIRD
jgi:sugar O-acyltransferase (sialic acid O-acetyltransferase NeuD family)